jgi:hypothetical protein
MIDNHAVATHRQWGRGNFGDADESTSLGYSTALWQNLSTGVAFFRASDFGP